MIQYGILETIISFFFLKISVTHVEPPDNEEHVTTEEEFSEQDSVIENSPDQTIPPQSTAQTMTTPPETTSQQRRHISILTPTHSHHDHHGNNHRGNGYDGHDDIDPEIARLDYQLDTWCLELKRNVLVNIIVVYDQYFCSDKQRFCFILSHKSMIMSSLCTCRLSLSKLGYAIRRIMLLR